ncbi:MAG: hypothetical protein M9951_00410 [Burkholderiaceae bacterium]|jgi:hypothetical protein|nr:hypothetical protein [Burkholderiaceae bacterium]MEB2317419.1 hypothetical protein [Pseudomonadota bacterium]
MTRSTREDVNPKVGDKPLKGPHERDESTGAMAPGADRASGRRAYDDLAAGRTDTDLRGSAREIIERAQREDARARGGRQDAEGKPASEEASGNTRPVPNPVKE